MPSNKPESIWVFRAAAVQWLRYERQCPIVSIERGLSCGGTPDVIGLSSRRFVTEIEIKRTVADFKCNAKKLARFEATHERGERLFGFTRNYPSLFYFLVPEDIEEKVTPLLRPGQGLMVLQKTGVRKYRGIPYPRVARNATVNPRARRLSVKEAVQMAKHQSGTLFSILTELTKYAVES